MAEHDIDGLRIVVPDALLNARIAAKLEVGSYEAQEARAAAMRLRAGQRVLELGAGIGYVSAICARVTGARNVTCVEANPELLTVIRANLERNGYAGVTLVHGAVIGRDSPEAPVAFDGAKSFWAGRIAADAGTVADPVEVPALGLDALLEEVCPQVVIMDIEGAEQHLFDAPWPAHVHSVMMELHPGRYADTVVQRIVDCMSESGLTYDPGPSCGRILCFRRVRGRKRQENGARLFPSPRRHGKVPYMNTRITSSDGTPASRFAFGTMQFGGAADEAASRAMFDACLDAGITHFDTAHLYTDGAAETLLGRFAAPHRDRLVIATKAGYAGGAGRDNILAQFDTSRRRLGMDHVEILYLHRFDPDTPLLETIETFADLKSRGLISHVGLSNFAAWQVMKAACIAERFDLQVSILQPMYNLVKRQAEVEILPMAASEGMVVAAYSPLAGGLLTGKYARGETGRLTGNERYAIRYGQDWMTEATQALVGIARELGTDPATLAVAWAARHPAAAVPLISGRSAEQIAPALAALDYKMDDALYARLAALTPAPPPATDRTEEA